MRQAVRYRHRKSETTSDEEITEEDSEGNKYVGRVIKPDERPFYRDSPSSVAVDSSLSPIQIQGSSNVTPRRLCFSLNSPTGTARCPSPAPYRPHTPGHPSAPRHSPAASSYPLVAATHLSENSSDAVASAVDQDESEPFDPTRTLHFSSVASRHTPAVMTSGRNFSGEDSNSVELMEPARPHSVELLRASGLPNSALINNDVLAHWRWLLDAIPDADAENSEAETSSNEDIHHTRHQNHGFNEYEAMDIDQPDIELDAGEDLIRLRSRPIPLINDPHFPQEKTLAGLRGKKATLKELFYLPSMAL
ncbi:hypothetical protein DVH05_008398 [Phytophthora capsici]|nr:hypothetical protein DVH05_008398 [Phytophthora capsici]